MRTWDQLLHASIQNKAVDVVPSGYKSAKGWGKHFKKNDRTVEDMMEKLNIKPRMFRVLCGRNVVSVKHWKI